MTTSAEPPSGERGQRCLDLVSRLSKVIHNKVRAAGVESWLDELPQLLADLEERWSITLGPILDGGTEAFVANAAIRPGAIEAATTAVAPTAAVLKVLVPHDERVLDEITVLEIAQGDGCPHLFRSDRDNGALLMERLGRPLVELNMTVEQRLDILTAAAAKIWRPAPESGLRTGADKGRWLAETIPRLWEDLDRPCSEQAVSHALDCAERRIAAHDDERAVLVHGDVHQWNALEAGDGFKLVDPDGLMAEPEYDLGILMREDPVELMTDDPRTRSRRLAAATGLNEAAIWEWGVVERLSTGLVATEIDLQPVAKQMLDAAETIATSS